MLHTGNVLAAGAALIALLCSADAARAATQSEIAKLNGPDRQKVLEVGAGIHIVETAGMHGRFVGTGTMAGIGLPFATFVQMRQRMAPLLGDASSFDRMRDVVPGQVLVVVPMMHSPRISAWSLAERDVRIADLGVTATVGLVSVSLGFSPGEVLDLLLGFVGIDLAGDDVADKPRRDASEMTELPVYDVQSLPATPR